MIISEKPIIDLYGTAIRPAFSDIAVAAVFIAGIAAMAATYGSDHNLIAHAFLGAAPSALSWR